MFNRSSCCGRLSAHGIYGELPFMRVFLRKPHLFTQRLRRFKEDYGKIRTIRPMSATWIRTQFDSLPVLRAESLSRWWGWDMFGSSKKICKISILLSLLFHYVFFHNFCKCVNFRSFWIFCLSLLVQKFCDVL